jgi:hypothetical protein
MGRALAARQAACLHMGKRNRFGPKTGRART